MSVAVPLIVSTSPVEVPFSVNSDSQVDMSLDMEIRQVVNMDYNELINKPSINGIELCGDRLTKDLGIVYDGTSAYWAGQIEFIPQSGAVVVYSDYATIDDKLVPNMKIGDGTTYVVDLPFVSDDLRAVIAEHITDKTTHISAADRARWDNKVTCDVILLNAETGDFKLVFAKE